MLVSDKLFGGDLSHRDSGLLMDLVNNMGKFLSLLGFKVGLMLFHLSNFVSFFDVGTIFG